MRKKLTRMQEMFVKEYLVDLNATEAAKRAGYSAKTAEALGSRLLSYPHVREAVDEAMKERSQRTGITAERVVEGLARIAFADIRRIFDSEGRLLRPDQLGDEIAAAVAFAEVETRKIGEAEVSTSIAKIRLLDKVRPLELLGKHLGMFSDRLKVEGEVKFVVIDYDPEHRPAGFIPGQGLIKGTGTGGPS